MTSRRFQISTALRTEIEETSEDSNYSKFKKMKQAEQARKISIEFAPLVTLCMKEIDSACNSVYKELWVH